MFPATRMAFVRWILGILITAASLLIWPQTGGWALAMWLAAGSVVLVTAAIHHLGLSDFEMGKLSILPTAALAAMFTLGAETALTATTLGLLLWTLPHTIRRSTGPHRAQPWWEAAGNGWLAITQNGMGLLAAMLSARLFHLTLPLPAPLPLSQGLPVLITITAYLIGYNTILLSDTVLRGFSLDELHRQYRTLIPALQILPMALAPFTALASASMGITAFLFLELILLTLALVVKRLAVTQQSLHQQIDQLGALSAVSQSLRSNLDFDNLVLTAYRQAERALGVENVMLVLRAEDESAEWEPRFVTLNGQPLDDPGVQPLDGLTRWVLAEAHSLYTNDPAATAAQIGADNPPPAQAWMGMPLVAADQLLGCITTWVADDQLPARTFNEQDYDLFDAIAVQGEMALQNAMLYQEAQRDATQLAHLNEISALLNSSLNPEQVLKLVVSSAADIAGCDRAAIYLLNGEGESAHLVLVEIQGFDRAFMTRPASETLPLSEQQRRAVISGGEALTAPNITSTPGVSEAALRLAASEGFAAYACLPLTAQDERIGLLALYYDQPHDFRELGLLEIFANQAALAVANAQIFHQMDYQLARRTSQMARMTDISQWLSTTLDLGTIFRFIVNSAMEGCEADAGMLVLQGDPNLDPPDAEPQMVAWRGFDTSSRRAPHHIAEELAFDYLLTNTEPRIVSVDDPREPGPRSQLSSPVEMDGEVIGAIVLESERLNAFSEEDLNFVKQLTVHAASAIRNGGLYRHAQQVSDRLHATLDASSDGLLMIDKHARVVMSNARMEDFRAALSSEGGDTLRALSEGLGYPEGELERLLKEGQRRAVMPARHDLTVTQGKNGQRYVERSVRPVYDNEEQFIGLLLVFRDVTEQKELEQIQQDLTSMIVHELRSPLQAMMGGMRLIEEVTGGETPVVQQAIAVSRRAVKKLLNLVNNLLDLSQMEQGKFVLDPAIERIEPILHDAVEELSPLAGEMDVKLAVDSAPNLPEAHIDRDIIDRVVLNLLDNALKYTSPGTDIRLHADSGEHQAPGMLIISVTDKGPGVPDEYKTSIFDRFTQIPGRRGHRRSAGLGLAFCKLAVESHGGDIWVEDNPAGGSIFRFTVPTIKPPPHPTESDEPEPHLTRS